PGARPARCAPRPVHELVPACRSRTVHATSWVEGYELVGAARCGAVRCEAAMGRVAARWGAGPGWVPAGSAGAVAVALAAVSAALRTRTWVPSSYGARYELGAAVRVGRRGGTVTGRRARWAGPGAGGGEVGVAGRPGRRGRRS